MTRHFSWAFGISPWLKFGGHIFYKSNFMQAFILYGSDQENTIFQQYILSLGL